MFSNIWACPSHFEWDLSYLWLHYYYCLLLECFSYQFQLMVFHWTLRDSQSLEVAWTLLSILSEINNIVIWRVSVRPVISKSSSLFYNPLVIVPKSPNTIGIIVTFMFNSFFFQFPSKVQVLILFFYFFPVLFCGQPGQQILSLLFYYYCFIIIIIYSLRVFYINCNRWSFLGVWVTSLQDFSQYHGRSQRLCSLKGLYSSSNFQFPHSFL